MMLRIKEAQTHTASKIGYRGQLVARASCDAASSWHQLRGQLTWRCTNACWILHNYVHDKEHYHIEIEIKASKTDQFRQGAKIMLGFTGAQLCPGDNHQNIGSVAYQRHIRSSATELAAIARDIAGARSQHSPPKQWCHPDGMDTALMVGVSIWQGCIFVSTEFVVTEFNFFIPWQSL